MIIPIGIQCTNTTFKKTIENTPSLPFDWMLSNPLFVYEMLELLLEQNMNIEDLVKQHFFNCEKKVKYTNVEHYYTCDDGNALLNTKYNVIFPHDEDNMDSINKYIRRFERLKQIILNSTECLYFIYTSQSSLESGNFTIDGNIVINDVYVSLSKIYKLISKFRNNYKIILFDTIQNEPISLLDENIIFIKLNPCNHLNEIVPQMIEHNYILQS
jgi:hypothetical protein